MVNHNDSSVSIAEDEDEFYTNAQGMVCRKLSDADWEAIVAKEQRKNDMDDYNHQWMTDEEIAAEKAEEERRRKEYMEGWINH